MKFSILHQYSKGKLLSLHQDSDIKELVIDTRKVSRPEQALFIALVARRNGHDFIQDAYDKGIRNFLVSVDTDYRRYESSNFILVDDTLLALQKIAAANRAQLNFPIIGITGSNGKTIVKELLFQLLSNTAPYNKGNGVFRSPKSYNSQIGVPLSVWLMQTNNTLGIIEAGISQPDEMEHSERIIKPDIGIFTNIGEAHNEGFLNIRQKINEKLKLFRHVKQLVYSSDCHDIHEAILNFRTKLNHEELEQMQLFTWSKKTEATLQILHIKKSEHTSEITARYHSNEMSISLPYVDDAYIENAIHCWCVMLLLDIDQAIITDHMAKLQAVSMRLELIQGEGNTTLINDTYNSDITSLKIAINFLEQQKHQPKHTLILSDILQVGRPDIELYEEIALMLSQRNIYRFIGIGDGLYKHKSLFRQYKKFRSIFFKSTEDFIKKMHLLSFENEAILLKGARAFRFEKIEKLLEQKIHKTVLEVSLPAISNNLNIYRKKLSKHTKLMAMVKAFSYGNGSYEIANVLQYEGVDYLAVAYTDEGVALRRAGITMPIMVMSPDSGSFDRMISWKLEPEIFNLNSLQLFLNIAQTIGVKQYPVHIKLDTGMHRLGFLEKDIAEMCQEILKNESVKVASVFSHLAGSDTALLDDFTKTQSERFNTMSEAIIKHLGYTPIRHLTNTAGISRHENLHYDMVRLGIGLYGIDANPTLQKKLQTISQLKTIIVQIKNLPMGETVGYSRNGKITRASCIATVAIGYADGYRRDLGNGVGHMLVKGKVAPLVGNVCMDMCMIDITDIPDVKEGDEVIVFNDKLTVSDLAKWTNTIPYEIMTSISQRVKRVYIHE